MILKLCCALNKLWGMKQINADLQIKDRIIPCLLNLTCQLEAFVKKKLHIASILDILMVKVVEMITARFIKSRHFLSFFSSFFSFFNYTHYTQGGETIFNDLLVKSHFC